MVFPDGNYLSSKNRCRIDEKIRTAIAQSPCELIGFAR